MKKPKNDKKKPFKATPVIPNVTASGSTPIGFIFILLTQPSNNP